MALVINGILEESRDYYRKFKRDIIGRLLINPRGSLYRKMDGGSIFLYLRRLENKRKRHIYIGKADSAMAKRIAEGLARQAKAVKDVRVAKEAMKELGMSATEIRTEDFSPIIQQLFQVMSDAGLWDEGLTLIGSWCFKIYQNYCGVEYYPERTLDVDFAIHLPYLGPKINLGELLKGLGLEEVINHTDGTIFYRSGDLEVEFLKNRVGDGRQRSTPYEPDLGIAPVAVPYMRILLDHSMEIKARDLGRVMVPSLTAFFLHKLLVASERRQEDKRIKDYRQVEAVAKTILPDTDRMEEVKGLAAGLHKKWVKKIAALAQNCHAGLKVTLAVLRAAGIIEPTTARS